MGNAPSPPPGALFPNDMRTKTIQTLKLSWNMSELSIYATVTEPVMIKLIKDVPGCLMRRDE